ncbi:MAG: ABC transporter ATP-binding protein [Chloroflexia bacterium]
MERGWIHLSRVTKRYEQGGGTCVALQDVCLDLPQGAFVTIVGPSGSGKTTLLNLVTGIDRPSAGEVWVGDSCLSRLSEEDLARWRGRHVGIVFQFFQLIPTLTALENVQLPLELYPSEPAARRRQRAWEALEQVGLADRAHHLPSQLSGGEQQRVALARALVRDPCLIAADEPTGNLDSASGRQVLELLEAVHRGGRTVLLVTHDRQLAAAASCEVQLLDGRVVAFQRKEARCASGSWPGGAK